MTKKYLSLIPLFLLLVACAARPNPLSPTAPISPKATKPLLQTATPQLTATGKLLPAIVTMTNIPTIIPGNVNDLKTSVSDALNK